MPKLRNMVGETGTVEIAVPGDEPLVIVYRRGSLTPRLQVRAIEFRRLIEASRFDELEPQHVTLICDLLAASLVSWNLTDDDGETLPIDPESLANVDMPTLTMIANRLQEETQADPLSGDGSRNGSSPTASSADLLTTTTSS